MKRVAAKFVPRLLSRDQRANRLDVCREMNDQLKTDPDFFFIQNHYRRGIMMLRVRPGDKATIKSMHHPRDPPKKGEASQIKCEKHVDLLL